VDPRDFGKPQIYEMRKERETTIGSSAQVVLEIIVIAKPELVQNRNTYKQQIPKISERFGKCWSPFSELQELLKIATACKSCAGEYPGTTHAHTDVYFNEFGQIVLAKHSRPKKQKKTRKCRKPCILKIHEGSREIMPFGRLAIIVQEKKVWTGPGNFFHDF
jgi:hypothetical protein